MLTIVVSLMRAPPSNQLELRHRSLFDVKPKNPGVDAAGLASLHVFLTAIESIEIVHAVEWLGGCLRNGNLLRGIDCNSLERFDS